MGRKPPHPTGCSVGLLIFGPLLSISVWVLPWKNWFPGTAVYAGDASWLVRNSPLLSLVGVFLTLITFALSVAISIYLSPRQPAVQIEPTSSDSSSEK